MTDKKFRFRLASVLRVAHLREKQAKNDVARRASAAAKANREAQERRAAVELSELHPVTELSEFMSERDRVRLRADAASRAEALRHQAEIELSLARDQWLAASRRARSLDRLEDRHHAAHAMVAARAAQRSLDDLVQIRRARGAR